MAFNLSLLFSNHLSELLNFKVQLSDFSLQLLHLLKRRQPSMALVVFQFEESGFVIGNEGVVSEYLLLHFQ